MFLELVTALGGFQCWEVRRREKVPNHICTVSSAWWQTLTPAQPGLRARPEKGQGEDRSQVPLGRVKSPPLLREHVLC